MNNYEKKTPSSKKEQIDINLIDTNSYQPRFNPKDSNLDKLKKNIDSIGFIFEPIIVHQKENGRYELIDGERRWRNSENSGDKTIEALVYKNLTKKDIMNIIISSFNQKEGITPIEEAIFYKKTIDDRIYRNETELAKKQGVSNKYITSRLAILNLPYEIQVDVKEKIYTNIEVLLKINSFINKYIKIENLKLNKKEITKDEKDSIKELVFKKTLKIYQIIKEKKLNQKEAIDYINQIINKENKNNSIKNKWGLYSEETGKVKVNLDINKLPKNKKNQALKHIKALKEILLSENKT